MRGYIMTELSQKVKQVIMDHLEIPEGDFSGQTSFSKELGLDSLDAMDMLMAIDEAFNVRIPVKEMEGIDNLDQLTAAIEKLLS
jgi:acyl carrier protein